MTLFQVARGFVVTTATLGGWIVEGLGVLVYHHLMRGSRR